MEEKLFIRVPSYPYLLKEDVQGAKAYIVQQIEQNSPVIVIPAGFEVCIAPEDTKIQFLEWR